MAPTRFPDAENAPASVDATGRDARRAAPGRPPGPRSLARLRTEERLLDGALEAVARYGLAKVSMTDVSACAGVSRGTAYRYYPDLDALLSAAVTREATRFEQEVWEAMERVPDGEGRLAVALGYASRLARENPVLQRLPDTDPGLVLDSLRERFPDIRASFERLFAPLLAESAPVRAGLVTTDLLVDWTARLLISTFLFPDDRLGDTAAALTAIYRLIEAPRPPDA